MKNIVVLLLLVFVPTLQLFAQNNRNDFSTIKRELGYTNGRNFKPTTQIRKAFRNHKLTNTSDYFNPTIQTVSNLGFLKDSVYVKSYKNAAYNNSVRNIKLNRTIIIGGSVIIVGGIVVALVVIKLVAIAVIGLFSSAI